MKSKINMSWCIFLCGVLWFVTACQKKEEVEVQVFIAASLQKVMTKAAESYHEKYPDVKIVFQADSSGILQTQIEEGFSCDLFFPAAQKQMNELEEKGFLVDDTRANVVKNRLVVIAGKNVDTEVKGLETLQNAKSIAMADGSVPVGHYTRQALINLGILEENEDPSNITTQQLSESLNKVEISEQGNVSKVLLAVAEESCEVGTAYYSDTYGYEDKIQIIEEVPYELTGNVIYPIAQIVNPDAGEKQRKAASEFLQYILSDEAKTIFESFYFDTNVER